MGDTRTVKIIVTGDTTSAQRALGGLSTSASKADGHLGKMGGALTSWWGKAAALFGGAAIGKMALDSAKQLEKAEQSFTRLLGSGEKAKTFLEQLKDFAGKSPFEFTGLSANAQKLLAMGVSAKNVIPYMKATGDAVAAVGGGQPALDNIVRVLGMMEVGGKITGRGITAMTRTGVPAIKILAEAYGVSDDKMKKMVSTGQVASSRAIPLLINAIENGTKSWKGFGGAAEASSKTAAVQMDKVKEQISLALGTLAQKVLPLLAKAFGAVASGVKDFFAGLSGKGPLQGFSGAINTLGLGIRALIQAFQDGDVTSDGFVGVMEQIGVVVRQVVDVLGSLWGWLTKNTGVIKVAAIVLGGLMVVGKAYNVVMGITNFLTKLQAAGMEGLAAKSVLVRGATMLWTAAQWLLNTAFLGFPLVWIVAAIAAVVGAFVLLWNKCEGFRNVVIHVWQTFTDSLKLMGDAAVWLWDKAIRPAIRFIVDAFLGMAGSIIHAAAWAFGWVPGIGGKLQDAAKNFDTFRANVNKSLSGISDQSVNVTANYKSTGVKFAIGYSASLADRNSYATGGGVSGPGTGTSDSILARLSNGEHVWTAREVAAAGGHKAVEQMRKAVLGFAKGGAVFNIGTRTAAALSTVRTQAHEVSAELRNYLKGAAAAVMAAARAAFAAAASGATSGGSPVGVAPEFAWGRYPSGGIHRAYDYAVPVGTRVYKPLAGLIMRAGWDNTGFGNSIRTHDSDGNYSIFGHLSRILVKVGQFVGKGALIALTGNSGNSTGPHLHYERRHILYDPSTSFKFDQGGDLPPGLSLAYNGTGRPEHVVGPQESYGTVNVYVTVEGSVVAERDLVKSITLGVRDNLLRHASRNGGRTGLPNR